MHQIESLEMLLEDVDALVDTARGIIPQLKHQRLPIPSMDLDAAALDHWVRRSLTNLAGSGFVERPNWYSPN